MRSRVFIGLAVALVSVAILTAVARVSGGDASADDLKKLQGTWQLTEVDGKKAGEMEQVKLVIHGNKATLYLKMKDEEKKLTEATIKLDATKKPRHIDLGADEKSVTKSPSLGIYDLNGDQLKFMLGSESSRTFNGKEEFVPSKRPKDFSDKSEPVMTFKRVKG